MRFLPKKGKEKKFVHNAVDYQGRDVFSLKLKDPPSFTANPKGVLVLKLNILTMKAGAQAEGQQFFLQISTGRELFRSRNASLCSHQGLRALSFHGDVFKILTFDPSDCVKFRLFSVDNPGLCLAESELKPRGLFVSERSFQALERSLTLAGVRPGTLSTLLMYRASEFTKAPQGKLEMTLVSSRAARFEKEDYSPLMEFSIGDQRVFVDEELQMRKDQMNQESEFRRWEQQGHLALYTTQPKDVLAIKFFTPKKNKDDGELEKGEYTLQGCEMFDLSALVLTQQVKRLDFRGSKRNLLQDDDGTGDDPDGTEFVNSLTINLKRVCKQMSGEIKIRLNYLPKMQVKAKGAIPPGKTDII